MPRKVWPLLCWHFIACLLLVTLCLEVADTITIISPFDKLSLSLLRVIFLLAPPDPDQKVEWSIGVNVKVGFNLQYATRGLGECPE